MGDRRKNPRRIPRTEADCRRAEDRGIMIGFQQTIKIVLYILLDKHGAPDEDVQELAREITWLAQNIEDRKISWSFVDTVLRENGIEETKWI